MKQLSKVIYPRDFVNPGTGIVNEAGVDKLIQGLSKEHWCIATGDALVTLCSTGFVEVYKLVGECEVEVNW